jgi:FkbM family methyltransferase
VKTSLRALRAAHSSAAGRAIAARPGLEPAFIAVGRWLMRRSRLLGTLYWFAEDDLVHRLRRSGRCYRRLPVAGIDMYVDVSDGTGRLHYFHDEPYEPQLARTLRELLKPGDVFVDVGANVGFFSVLAGRIVGKTGRVVAFEPHPEALARFRQAVTVNGLSEVIEIVEAAVGDASGTTRLFLSNDSVLSTTDPARAPLRDDFTFSRSIDVRRLTLDGWLAERQDLALRLRAIKIDVEGTEADVLDGMRRTLAACPDAAILCETEAGSTADNLLRAEGYAVSLLERYGAIGNYLYRRAGKPGASPTGAAP